MATNVDRPAQPIRGVGFPSLTVPRVAWGALARRGFVPVDIASLVAFRIAFGMLMCWEVFRYFGYGWIGTYYIDPAYNFTYWGFGWVKPWPGDWMYAHFFGLGVLALMMTAGVWYHFSATFFFLGFTYVFLLDKAHYLNHFYLISLVSFLMIFVPANRAFSIDALLQPKLRSNTIPVLALWLLRAQFAIIYIYGGVAKLNGDWLRGEPMRMWLAGRPDFPVIGRWFTEEWMVYLFSYGGLLFDLLIVPLILWPRTRWFAFAAAIAFHMTNQQLFSIGIFPWFGLAASVLFFPPHYPRRVAQFLFGARRTAAKSKKKNRRGSAVVDEGPSHLRTAQVVAVSLVAAFLAIQVLMPLRHHLYPGNVAWTEEGHRFSWRMKLRNKDGNVRFFATIPATGQSWEIDPDVELTNRQLAKMATQPDMILQYSHHLADDLAKQGIPNAEIRASAMVSLNGRPFQQMIDPTANLVAQGPGLAPEDWILPFEETLATADEGSGGSPGSAADAD